MSTSLQLIVDKPKPCCTVGAVVSVTSTVTLTTDATSLRSGRATLTSPVARFTVKNSYNQNILGLNAQWI